ncbi:MAG TPA: hypothetical protein P5032_14900 [Candidatus Competibacter sp.]|nr:hypothetical protein [Candidatus Competibacter sp.]
MGKITRKQKVETRNLSVRVPLPLFEELQAFRQEVQAFDDTMIFNINELIVTALKRDLRVAKEELDSLKAIKMKPPAVMQTTADPVTTAQPAATPPSPSVPTREADRPPAAQVPAHPTTPTTQTQPRPRFAEAPHQGKPG